MRPRYSGRRNLLSAAFPLPGLPPAFHLFKKPRPTSHTLQLMNYEAGSLNFREAGALWSQELLRETSPVAQPRAANQESWGRRPKSSLVMGSMGAEVFFHSGLLFRFLICAPSQFVATDKAWGRLPKTPSIPGILGAGVFLPLSSDFWDPLPRLIL